MEPSWKTSAGYYPELPRSLARQVTLVKGEREIQENATKECSSRKSNSKTHNCPDSPRREIEMKEGEKRLKKGQPEKRSGCPQRKPIRLTVNLSRNSISQKESGRPIFSILKEKNFPTQNFISSKLSFISGKNKILYRRQQMLRFCHHQACPKKGGSKAH